MEVSNKIRIVVLTLAVFAEVLGEVWKKYSPEPFRLITVGLNDSLKDILAEKVIADSEIADRFVLVPAHLIPCSRVSFEELCSPVVYVFKEKKTWWGRTPVLFDKSDLETFLPGNDQLPDEDFVRKWVTEHLTRPVLVSPQWGNYIMPVLRADPCWAVVAEAMVLRKFLYANSPGFSAIVSQVRKVLL